MCTVFSELLYLNCWFDVYTALICPFLVCIFRKVLRYYSLAALNFPMWVITWILYPWEPPSITWFLQLGVKNLAHENFNGSSSGKH